MARLTSTPFSRPRATTPGNNASEPGNCLRAYRQSRLRAPCGSVQECRRMYADTPSIRRAARIIKVSQGTVKRALELDADPVGREG